jgi:hypothetical protein
MFCWYEFIIAKHFKGEVQGGNLLKKVKALFMSIMHTVHGFQLEVKANELRVRRATIAKTICRGS